MKKTAIFLIAGLVLLVLALPAQHPITIKIIGGQKPVIAIPDFRGSGEAQQYMNKFNETLFAEIETSGMFKMAAKSMFPLEVPQRPQDFRPPAAPAQPARKGQTPQPVRQGPWLTDWSGPPLSANYLAFGYTAVQDGQIVLFGPWPRRGRTWS